MSWPEAFAAATVLVAAIIAVERILEKIIEAAKEIWVARLLSRTKCVGMVLHDKDS